jgi:plasmid stabilization system protein ParE
MKVYNVEISASAKADIDELADFLFENMSREAAYRYLDTMGTEMKSLSVYADCFAASHSKTIKTVHPFARRMLSHNRKWNYVFHIIDGDTVVIDRVLKSKMIVR